MKKYKYVILQTLEECLSFESMAKSQLSVTILIANDDFAHVAHILNRPGMYKLFFQALKKRAKTKPKLRHGFTEILVRMKCDTDQRRQPILTNR